MNEKYFVAAYLRWKIAETTFNRIKENAPKVGDTGGKVSTWGVEVKAYREAQERAETAKQEFTRVASEYAKWLYEDSQ